MQRITLDGVADYARELIAACASTADAFPVRQCVDLAGLSIDVFSDHGALAQAMAYGMATTAPASGSPASIFLAHPAIGAMQPSARWGEELFSQQAFSARLEANGLRGSYFHDLRYWQFYDVEKRSGVQLMLSADGCPPWEFGAPLRCFLHWEYAARGQRLTHAGTLGIGGKGVLLAGGGGAGKSGTVVAGLLAGLDSVGDDYVLMDLSDGRATARPLFTTLKQDPAGFERLGLAARLPEPGELNWQGKYQFRVQDIAPRGVANRLEIAALLVPRISGGNKSIIEPLSRKDALMALAPSGIAQMPGERESGFRFFGELTRQLPCFRLSLGTRGDEIAETIAAFLESGRP
ncbi:serine kinase [Mesorhizobium sp. ANAO-SY3R2]|uniref:serine kinase n=1 Tax=Mesorhizobium sp. ANAO-SY3R2 TaxID=3166644 RepID=UPI00366E163A